MVAFSSTAFVMDTSFQRPNYDTEDVCKAQHEKGRSTAKETIKIGHAYVLEFWWLCSFQMRDTKSGRLLHAHPLCLTLLHPLGIISRHSVMDAPNNSKFLDFSQLHPYFHPVFSFFTFFCNFYKKITVNFFFHPKKE